MDKMNSLNWIVMFEAFEAFKEAAKRAGFNDDRIRGIDDHIMNICPIPQPHKMDV